MKKSIYFLIIYILINLCTFTQSTICRDVNTDNSVNIIDALVTAQHYVGLSLSVYESCNADVNGDNSKNILDALLIAQFYVGLLSKLDGCPYPCSGDGKAVILVIDPIIEGDIRTSIDQFKTDIENVGYSPLEYILTETNPVELKEYYTHYILTRR